MSVSLSICFLVTVITNILQWKKSSKGSKIQLKMNIYIWHTTGSGKTLTAIQGKSDYHAIAYCGEGRLCSGPE